MQLLTSFSIFAVADRTLALAIQVQKADDNMEGGMALVTVHIDHAQYDMGREVQCLNAIVKGDVPLQVIRMTGPDLVLGALASMAACPYVLLRAAELRQASCYIESIPACSVAATQGAWGHLEGSQISSSCSHTLALYASCLREA